MGKRKWILLGMLLFLLALLLALVPAEKKLGIWIKPVLFHGAITWVSFVFFGLFGLASVAYLITGSPWLFGLAERGYRVGTAFWVLNFFIWVPMSLILWNSIFGEPRAKASVWVLLFLGSGYVLSQFIRSNRVLAGIYGLIGIGIVSSFSGLRKVLHPLDPVGTSNSVEIKFFFAAIAFTCLIIGLTLIVPKLKRE